jgi:hypothetical protein
MRNLPFIFIYLIFVILWCVVFYQFMAPVKDTQQILLLGAATAFYSLIWWLMISLFQRMIGWNGYGMLIIPVIIAFVFFVGMPKSSFLFICGLIAISELVSYARIIANRKRKRA